MKKMSALDRILLLVTGLLAAYQIVVGIDHLDALPIVAYTVAFGVLLVAGLLLIIFGFDALDSPLVVIVAAIIPLGLSLGLVAQYLPTLTTLYTAFAVVGLIAIAVTRFVAPGRVGALVLAVAHGIAGLIIFGLPILFSLQGKTPMGFALVGVGGALIGLGGLLLAFLKAGKPILSQNIILAVLPGLLLLTTAAFVAGFAAAPLR
jgi:hypothetical protein